MADSPLGKEKIEGGEMRKIALIALLALGLSFCSRGFKRAPFSKTPVFIIIIDTLRADHVSVFNPEAERTKTWEELASDGVVFENAYSHIPLTLPSHTTLFTGMIPPHTGVRDNIGFKYEKKEKTIAEWMKAHGKRTAGFVSAIVLHHRTGISRGFDFYEDKIENTTGSLSLGAVQRPGIQTVHLAEDWLDKQKDDNFFMFLHIYEPHSPYKPPERFRKEGRSLYEGEVLYADEIIGEFIRYLKDMGIYKKALIVMAADHGEGLKNHGESEHGVFLYIEDIHIPLVIKYPYNQKPFKRIKRAVALTDIFPTLCDYFQIKCPHKMDGESLLSQKKGTRDVYSESLYGKYHYGWAPQYSLIDGRNHFILSPIREFYDLLRDPMEKKNRYGFGKSKKMERILKAMVSQFKEDRPSKVDPEFLGKLMSLGYVGIINQKKLPSEKLPDPKTKIHLLEKLNRAMTLARLGLYRKAAEILDSILKEDPDMEEVISQAARVNENAGNYRRAIELYKELLKRRPNDISAIIGIGSVYFRMGLYKEAIKHINLLIEKDPKMALGYSLKAMVYFKEKKYRLFYKYLKKALKLAPDLDHAHYLLGLDYLRLGVKNNDPSLIQKAKEEFLKVEKKNVRGYVDMHFNLGVIFSREGDYGKAEEEYRKEIKFFPSNPKPYVNLALLLDAEGDLPEAIHTLLIGEKVAPVPQTYYLLTLFYMKFRNPRAARKWLIKGLSIYPKNQMLLSLKKNYGF